MQKLTITTLALCAILLAGCTTTSTGTTEPSNTVKSTDNSTATTNSDTPTTSYTLEQVAQHNSSKDCWLVVSSVVYDVTAFISSHPGGNEITRGCGKDATALFSREREHKGSDVQSMLADLKIGQLQ